MSRQPRRPPKLTDELAGTVRRKGETGSSIVPPAIVDVRTHGMDGWSVLLVEDNAAARERTRRIWKRSDGLLANLQGKLLGYYRNWHLV
jgi:hypothetical protein